MPNRYKMFASYNAWANDRLYESVRSIPDADYRADRGAFFKSIHGTLNHLLAADYIWLRRFTGEGEAPAALDALLFDDLHALTEARKTTDRRIHDFIDGLDDARLDGVFRYRPVTNPTLVEQRLAPALDHFFNHHTHHRGQIHALLTGLGHQAPSFDLVLFQRQAGLGGVRLIAD